MSSLFDRSNARAYASEDRYYRVRDLDLNHWRDSYRRRTGRAA